MAARKTYHVTYSRTDDRWVVKLEGGFGAISTHFTKESAVDAARSVAKANPPSQVIVHLKDGTIETEYTYGDDPYPPPG